MCGVAGEGASGSRRAGLVCACRACGGCVWCALREQRSWCRRVRGVRGQGVALVVSSSELALSCVWAGSARGGGLCA